MAKKLDVKEDKMSLLATATEYDTIAYGEKLKLSDLEQKSIIRRISQHVEKVKNQRIKEGIEDEWKDALDLKEGVVEWKDFPYEGSHNLHIHITRMVGEILKEKIKRRTHTRPVMLARPRPGLQKSDKFVIQKKTSFVNDKVLGEMNLEEVQDPIIDDAIYLGTGIGKIRHVREMRPTRKLEVYDPTIEDIARFTEDFEDDKGSDTYRENLKTLNQRLKDGEKEPVSVWVEVEEIVKFQPVLDWVDPLNLYLDYYIKDMRYQRIIPEKHPDISWDELSALFDNGYFDKENKAILEDLKKKYSRDKEYEKRTYTVWETNYVFEYKKSEIRSLIFHVDEMPEKIAKAISFPYLFNEPNYILWKVMGKRNSIYGTGIAKLLKDTNVALNEFWNLHLDAAEFNVAPMMVANITSQSFDPSSKKIGPATIWWLGQGDKLTPMQNSGNIGESYRLLSFLHNYAEWITGVSAYMTGQANTLDPRAPASKAYMLLQESNLRVNAYIRRIDQSNIKLFECAESLYFQYFNDTIKFYEKSDEKEYVSDEISRKELGTPVNWVPQLSDLTTNKALEKEEDMNTAMFLLKLPMVAQMPSSMRRIIEIILRNRGGEWEKAIPDLLPDAKETDVINKVMDLMKTVGPKGVMDIMASMMDGATPPSAEPGKLPPTAEAQMGNPAQNIENQGV